MFLQEYKTKLTNWGTSHANEQFQGWRVKQITKASTLKLYILLVFPWVYYDFLVFVGFFLGFAIKSEISY